MPRLKRNVKKGMRIMTEVVDLERIMVALKAYVERILKFRLEMI